MFFAKGDVWSLRCSPSCKFVDMSSEGGSFVFETEAIARSCGDLLK